MNFPAHVWKYCLGVHLSDVATVQHADPEIRADGFILRTYFSLFLYKIERKLPLAICYKLYLPPAAGAQWDSLQRYIIACSLVCCL